MEMKIIQKNLKKTTQHIMVSATFSPHTIATCKEMCPDLTEIYIDLGNLDLSGLVQFFEILSESEKMCLLEKYILMYFLFLSFTVFL